MKFQMNWTAMAVAMVFCLMAALYLGVFEQPMRKEIDALRDHQNKIVVAVNDVKQVQEEKILREQVVDLPEDGGMWFTSVMVDDLNSHVGRRLRAMFETTPRLRSLAVQTHFNAFTPKDQLFASRPAFHNAVGTQTPMVLIQDNNGKVIYKATGKNIPNDGEVLADQIQGQIHENCIPCRPNKPNQPGPVSPVPESTPPVIEDTNIAKPEVPDMDGDILIGAMVVIGILSGLALGWRRNQR